MAEMASISPTAGGQYRTLAIPNRSGMADIDQLHRLGIGVCTKGVPKASVVCGRMALCFGVGHAVNSYPSALHYELC